MTRQKLTFHPLETFAGDFIIEVFIDDVRPIGFLRGIETTQGTVQTSDSLKSVVHRFKDKPQAMRACLALDEMYALDEIR